MHLSASDLYSYYRPSLCDLRVYLRQLGEPEAAPSPYEEVLRRLAVRHEKAHLAIFPQVVDLSSVAWDERPQRTIEAVAGGAPVVYQGGLQAAVRLDKVPCEIVGNPDFLIAADGGYVVRDSKIAKRINEKDHPEIIYQLQLYGWLYEQTFGKPPRRLEVHSGPGDIVEIAYDGGGSALKALGTILNLKGAEAEFYSPVGWTKCNGCGFFDRCWPRAERNRDVALVSAVDQSLARTLHGRGIRTWEDLIRLGEAKLAGMQRPWGKAAQRVGKRASTIVQQANALASRNEQMLNPPALPEHSNYAMFDLEGLPPQLDEIEKVYLWGLQVFGLQPGPYLAAVADLGSHGDREGWEVFLRNAASIFRDYGDIPFVHWAPYEKTKLDRYIERYGDPDGVAARVRGNLLDLLQITLDSLVLPLPSYSLKIVERHVGYRQQKPEANGDWAMAKFIEAIETENPAERDALIQEIQAYNQEDLEATWAVLLWLREKRRAPEPGRLAAGG